MKLFLLETDDWECLYLDGKLIDEGHTVDWQHAHEKIAKVSGIGFELDTEYVDFEDEDEEGTGEEAFNRRKAELERSFREMEGAEMPTVLFHEP